MLHQGLGGVPVRCNGFMGGPFRFDALGFSARIEVGHAPAEYEYATASTGCSRTLIRLRGCALPVNEYSGVAAYTGSPYCLRWARLCMSLMSIVHRGEIMPSQPSDFAAVIGLDWADRKHDICLMPAGKDKPEFIVLEHDPVAIDAWASQLKKRFGGRTIAVCLELARGPIVSALLEYDFFVIFRVNPAALARYRCTFTPSHAKDDPTDAFLAVDFFQRHFERLAPLRRERPAMRALQRLVQDRRTLVDDRSRLINRVTYALKEYFPQVLRWFRDKHTDVFVDFVTRWPTLEVAQRAHRDTARHTRVLHRSPR